MADDRERQHLVTSKELEAALKQWNVDADRNGWSDRVDDERFADKADYLIHTIRLNRGEGAPPEKEG